MANKIVLELLADTSGLLKGLEQAQRRVDQFTESSDAAGQALGSGVNRALGVFSDLAKGGAAAAGVLAGGLVAASAAAVTLTLSAGKQIESLDQLAQKTGIAIQTLQGWSVIMAENGLQADSLTTGMRTLSKHLTDLHDPASKSSALFESLGLNITSLGSTDGTIRALADRFKAMADGPDKARLAVELFGKSGLELIPLLNRGSAAFDQSREAAARFGLVLSRDQVEALGAVDDASDRLGQALQGLKTQLAVTFAPSVTVGTNAITEGIARMTAAVREMRDEGGKSVSFFEMLKSLVPGASAMDAAARALRGPRPPSAGGVPVTQGENEDSHVQALARIGETQEEIGIRLRNEFIERFRNMEAERRAREGLGRVQLAIIQRTMAEDNLAFAQQVEQAEALQRLNEGLGQGNLAASGPFVESIKAKELAIENLLNLMPELNREEAILLALHNQDAGTKTVQASLAAYEHRNDALDDTITLTKAVDDAQQALYAQERAAFGVSDAARRVRFSLIDAEAARERQRIDETILDEQRKAIAIDALENQTEARRRQAIQQFPSFFEQQMQALVNANSFSMGSIVSTWTNGIGQMVVHGGNLKAAWEQTQVALVSAFLNAGVQMLAQAALSAAQQIGLVTATEAAKTVATATGAASRTAITAAEATAEVGIMTGAQTTILAMFATVGGALKALFFETLVPAIIAVGKFVIGVLAAIATAMKATIFGIPVGIAILVGIGAIVAALAATGNLGFKEGGIGDFGSGTPATLHGREAIIPLNERGAAFMRDVFGASGIRGGVGDVYLDGRKVGHLLERDLRSRAYREAGVMA